MMMAGVSMLGFVVLLALVGDYNQSIFKILVADLIGLIFLLLAFVLNYLVKSA